RIPLIRYVKAQGTYLTWLDVSRLSARIGAAAQAEEANRSRSGGGGDGGRNARKLVVTPETIVQNFLVKEAKVQINPGSHYGVVGEGHMRMNIGTSRRTLELALTNIADALARL